MKISINKKVGSRAQSVGLKPPGYAKITKEVPKNELISSKNSKTFDFFKNIMYSAISALSLLFIKASVSISYACLWVIL